MRTHGGPEAERTRRLRLPAPAVRVLVVAVVCLLPVAVTLQMKQLGEQAVRSERDLQGALTELVAQDALEWRAISGRVSPAAVQQQLTVSRQRAAELSSRALVDDTDGDGARVLSAQARYGAAVDTELWLLASGRIEQAEAFDEAEVDPAFADARDGLQEEAGELARAAARAQTLSDLGLLVTVVLSLGLVSLLQSRRRRSQVQHDAERRGEARYRALVDQSADLVLVVDPSMRVLFLSPSAERLLAPAVGPGRTRVDPASVDLAAALDAEDRPRLAAALQEAAAGTGTTVEVRITEGADRRTFEVSVRDLTGHDQVAGLVLTAHDVTDRLALQQEMEHRALHDTLTGLPNRALLGDRFEQALRVARRDGTSTGLLLIDLDRFKEINDTFGHHYGDVLLTQVGPRLVGALRDVDTIARLGGDEFAVLLPDASDVATVVAVAERIQAALEMPFRVEDVELDVEASIGAVLSGEHGTDPATLMQRADIAMYAAKTQGLGVFAYDPAVDGHSPAKLALLGDLRRALAQDELVLHYQPKVSLSTGDVVGVEALVRWEHPERGMVHPDQFIPLAEHTGLIGPLTQHVLSTALAQARSWADAGRPLTVSVNLSARNLLDERLPDQVAGLLAQHGVPAELLQLEVTESAIMTEPARAQRLLQALAALGVQLSIDDFGAGYTSLAQLKNLPVTELKIDKSFVLAMTEDRSDAVIVHSVVDLGHNLGLTLVAEGVESAHVLDALSGFGCDLAQGYHLSRPVPAAALDLWRASRSAAAVTAGVLVPSAELSWPSRDHLPPGVARVH